MAALTVKNLFSHSFGQCKYTEAKTQLSKVVSGLHGHEALSWVSQEDYKINKINKYTELSTHFS